MHTENTTPDRRLILPSSPALARLDAAFGRRILEADARGDIHTVRVLWCVRMRQKRELELLPGRAIEAAAIEMLEELAAVGPLGSAA